MTPMQQNNTGAHAYAKGTGGGTPADNERYQDGEERNEYPPEPIPPPIPGPPPVPEDHPDMKKYEKELEKYWNEHNPWQDEVNRIDVAEAKRRADVFFEDYDKFKPYPKEWKEEKKPGVNSYNIQMYHLNREEIQELDEGSMFFVESAVNIGPAVMGTVTLFNQDKYCTYRYIGVGMSKSILPIDKTHSKGIVENVFAPKDFENIFFNGSAVVGATGQGGSIGKNDDLNLPVLSYTQDAQSTTGGGIGGSVQWYKAEVNEWIDGEAPIDWGNTLWDKLMPSDSVEYYM